MMKALFLTATIALASNIHAQASSYFGPASSVSYPNLRVQHVSVDDVNGDGHLDIVVALVPAYYSTAQPQLAWCPNDGSGSFLPRQVIDNLSATPFSTTLADIDSDGDPDLIAAATDMNGVGTLNYYTNDGSGTFSPGPVISSNMPYARGLATGDLDSDGDLDLAVVASGTDTIAWFSNDGQGNFGPPLILSNSAIGARDITLADLDGDSDLEVIAASYGDDSISYFNNLGFGFFGQRVIVSNQANGALSVSVGDVDNDGDLDIMSCSDIDGKLAIYANGGSGSFGSQQVIWQGKPYDSELSDINGDGLVDVLVANNSNSSSAGNVLFWLNNGTGNYASSPASIMYVDYAGFVSAADLDNDGYRDVLSHSNFIYEQRLFWSRNQFLVPASSTYGQGCGNPSMTFTPTSDGTVGSSLSALVTNTPTPFCWGMYGASATTASSGISLPADLTNIGMPGCQLLMSADFIGIPTSYTGQAFQVTCTVAIPNTQALVGAHLYFQALGLAPGFNSRQLITSNGIDFLIGNQ